MEVFDQLETLSRDVHDGVLSIRKKQQSAAMGDVPSKSIVVQCLERSMDDVFAQLLPLKSMTLERGSLADIVMCAQAITAEYERAAHRFEEYYAGFGFDALAYLGGKGEVAEVAEPVMAAAESVPAAARSPVHPSSPAAVVSPTAAVAAAGPATSPAVVAAAAAASSSPTAAAPVAAGKGQNLSNIESPPAPRALTCVTKFPIKSSVMDDDLKSPTLADVGLEEFEATLHNRSMSSNSSLPDSLHNSSLSSNETPSFSKPPAYRPSTVRGKPLLASQQRANTISPVSDVASPCLVPTTGRPAAAQATNQAAPVAQQQQVQGHAANHIADDSMMLTTEPFGRAAAVATTTTAAAAAVAVAAAVPDTALRVQQAQQDPLVRRMEFNDSMAETTADLRALRDLQHTGPLSLSLATPAMHHRGSLTATRGFTSSSVATALQQRTAATAAPVVAPPSTYHSRTLSQPTFTSSFTTQQLAGLTSGRASLQPTTQTITGLSRTVSVPTLPPTAEGPAVPPTTGRKSLGRFIKPITETEYSAVPSFLTNQLSLSAVNMNVTSLNMYINTLGQVPQYLTTSQLENDAGLGARTRLMCLILSKTNRLMLGTLSGGTTVYFLQSL